MVDKRLPGLQETPPSKEAVLEVLPKEEINRPLAEKEEKIAPAASTTAKQRAPALQQKPAIVRDIETALEEGLSELYVAMPPALQAEFKQAGEETTAKIITILQKGKDMAKKVFEAIVEWLKLIPGVNKFFLEQEAKIKTDKILNIKK